MSSALILTRIQAAPIDRLALLRELPRFSECGAAASFAGVVRGSHEGRSVVRLEYECYESLATKELARVAGETAQRFGLAFVQAVHRTGALDVGEVAVYLQVLGGHRGEVFEGCRALIDGIKARVPIWKKEVYADGRGEWVRCHHE